MHVKKDYIWSPATCSCENSKYLASTIDNSVITCDEIIIAAGSAPTNVPTIVMSTVSTNVTRTASINVHNKKVRYKMNCYILYMVLLVVILLFIITVIGYHYAKNKSRQKNIGPLTMQKWRKMN